MIRRMKNVLFKSFSRVGETALLLAFFTFLSQLLALFRDRFLAGRIGVGESLDVYYAAFRIPDVLFIFAISLVSLSALLPFFQKELQAGKEQARLFLSEIFSVFILFILVLSAISFIVTPYLVSFLFDGFSSHAIRETTALSRIMLLSPILLGISTIFSTVVQSVKKFVIYAISPVLYNLGIILGILILSPYFGIYGVAYGVIIGAFFHLLIQYLVVRKESFTPSFSLRGIRWNKIISLTKTSLPRMVTLSLSHVFLLILLSYATRFTEGSVSLFQLSFNMRSVPLSLIGLSYSVASFPILVKVYQDGDYQRFLRSVFYPLRQIVFWSLPAITLFVVLRAHIVRVVLGTGHFNWSDTKIVAASLAILSLSVLAQGVNLLIIRAYYASGKTWRPFTILSSSLLITFPFLLFLSRIFTTNSYFRSNVESIFRIQNVQGSEVLVLSITYVFWTYLSLILFSFFFQKDFPFVRKFPERLTPWKSFFQSSVASVFLGLILYYILHMSVSLFNQHYTLGLFLHATISAFLSLILWFALLIFLKNEDAYSFRRVVTRFFNSFRRQIYRKDVTGDIEIHS